MSIKLMVFDIAGTTVKDDNEVAKAFQNALKTCGFFLPLEKINPFMGYEKHFAIKEILKEAGEAEAYTETVVKEIHQAFVNDLKVFYSEPETTIPLPNVESTMQTLHDLGIIVAINTGFSRDIADVIVKQLQWFERGLVDYMIASDEVAKGRPYPDMIHSLMKQAGIDDPSLVAKAGDTEVDINEGKNAGCKYVIGVSTGTFTTEELRAYDPTHIISDIAEVIDIIKA
ncbi:HAD-IA family hydrolase [Pontibacter sp. 13R65]|uniref:HAD-IA family hydrolase n=1 Tax=Pontibacter sp. 13R65 TaxID=3127458 RepID=UPI00301C0F40